MPAHRSRTMRWKDSLKKIRDRGGGLEFTLARDGSDIDGHDLVWRVRLHSFDDTIMTIEHPGALGHSFPIEVGSPLIGVITVGQNRWMFRSKVVRVGGQPGAGKTLVVEMPESVERCTRRAFGRTSIGEISLPKVEMWPLLNPTSATPVESASRVLIEQLRSDGSGTNERTADLMLPEVGPGTSGVLANIGGGGVGLILDPEQRSALTSAAVYWLAIDLRPSCPAPVMMAARMAHQHIDSGQSLHAGLAFDFDRSIDHQHFVLDEVDRFLRQTQQRGKKAA